MSKTYRRSQHLKVFVTTQRLIEVERNKLTTGAWFELDAYDSKTDFISACVSYLREKCGIENPTPYFYQFDVSEEWRRLIDHKDISSDVWEILDLESLEAHAIHAFYKLYPTKKFNSFDESMDYIFQRYIGWFESKEDMAVQYLNSIGSLTPLPALIHYIDIPNLAARLMQGKKVLDGHYFNDTTSIFALEH